MVDKTISDLTSATALTGAESMEVEQGGNSRETTAAEVARLSGIVRVRAATTANITISTALNNADSLDGVTLATGDLVLVKDQSTTNQNGIYEVGASPGRVAGFTAYNQIAGVVVQVMEGTVNADRMYMCTSNQGGTIDSTALAFSRIYTEAAFGRRHFAIKASELVPRLTNGPAFGTIEMATNDNNYEYAAHDTTTQELGDYLWFPPPSWDLGTVTYRARWFHPSTTTNFGVAWQLAGVAISDNETMDVALGTAGTVTDTGGTTSRNYLTSESSAITIAGTPAAGDMVLFRLGRVPANGSDNMAVDAYLLGIDVFYTENAATD